MSPESHLSWILIFMLGLSGATLAAQEVAEPWPEKVDALVMRDDHEFRVEGINRATYKVHQEIRVYNERGKKNGRVVLYENKYVKCKTPSGRIEDKDGHVLRELEKDEIFKTTRSPGYELFDDDKYQAFELGWSSYPYTVILDYEKEYGSLLFWPDWHPQADVPVLHSVYRLALEGDPVGYNTHAVGIDLEPVTVEEPGKKTIVWELEKIKPRVVEQQMPPENRVQMMLDFAPVEFAIDNYRGSFATWSLLGEWVCRLYSGRYDLPEAVCDQITGRISPEEGSLSKIQKLYAWLQEHSRYVAIELGVGSWQPYSAESVYRCGYGDCKGLSTLMIALLRQVGIPAYPVIIKTRDNGLLVKEFPSLQFNHVIACVPLDTDTVWLECTADYLAAGELPADDEGCEALLIGGGRGEIVHTPQSRAEDNRWLGKVEADLGSDGTLVFSGTITTTGNRSNGWRARLNNLKPEERKQNILNVLGRYVSKPRLSTCEVGNLSEHYDRPLTIRFEGTIDRFGVKSSNRISFNPNVFNRETADDVPKERVDERQFAVFHDYPYLDVDSVSIHLPEGYALESAPPPQSLATGFGRFEVATSVTGDRLIYCRTFRIDRRIVPLALYGEYLSFTRAAVNSDKTKVVLKSGTRP